MRHYTLVGLLAISTASSVRAFELPEGLADGSYIVKFYDNDTMSLYGRSEYMMEMASLAEASINITEAGTNEEYETSEVSDDVEAYRNGNIERCTGRYISPKVEAVQAYEQLKDNCLNDPAPHRPQFRDHHVAILEKYGSAIAFMCHWGRRSYGNQCAPSELDEVEVMTPCKEGTRILQGEDTPTSYVVSARKDFGHAKRGYGYDIYQAKHICRHHPRL